MCIRRIVGWALVCLGLSVGMAPAQAAGPRVAFVIGNAGYASEAKLANPVRDAALLAKVFRDLKFDRVIEKQNLTRSQLFDLVGEIEVQARGADAVAVYYSGHGMRGPGGNYLIPVDAKIADEAHLKRDAIAVTDVVDALKDSGARVALLLLDACRDNPYSTRTKSTKKGLARMNVSGGNLLVSYATSEGNTADDGTRGNSPYALALASALKDSDKPVLEQLDQVRRQVRAATGNTQNPTREGDLEVRVYLASVVPEPARPVTPSPAPAPVAVAPAPGPAAAPPAPTFAAGQEIKDCAECPEMVVLPAGSFEMGSNNGGSDEKPVHTVKIGKSFALGKTEVTQKQWRQVMGSDPAELNFKGCDDCPVERVSWNDIRGFLGKLNQQTGQQYRLPSEAEWEYACRAGGKHEYCGSDAIDAVAWYDKNSGSKTQPVAKKQANTWGLYDMSGNVWEWTDSCWEGDCGRRVLRGGSWDDSPDNARAAYRFRIFTTNRNYFSGFRLARMLP